MLQSLFHKVTGLQPSNFIKERLQRRYFPENIAKFLTTPFLKNICERMLLLIVIFLQENNRVQRCLDLPGPKLHKKLIFVMLVHSPQTTFHRKNNVQFSLDLSGQKQWPRRVLEKRCS